MAGKAAIYQTPRIVTFILRLALAVEIAAAGIVAVVLVAAGKGSIAMSPILLAIYQLIVKSLAVLPIAAGIATLFWIYSANRNARALSSHALTNTPGWSVGWWFVPFASLFKPYQNVLEIYKASRDPMNWPSQRQASIVGIWWLIYLAGNMLGLVITAISRGNGGSGIEMRPLAIGLYAIIAAHQALFLIIVSRIYRWQQTANRGAGVEKIF